jgi:4-hydroxythreonine-4-phosphate dehydrogenase
MEESSRRMLVVTQGDPEGIGPELLLRVAALGDLGPEDRVVADPGVLDDVAARIGADWAARGRAALAAVLAPPPAADQVSALVAAVDRVLARPGSALVTAPFDKAAAARAGFPHPGHTEYLAARAGVSEYCMALVGPRLRVALATIHVPLREVVARLSVDAIARPGRLLADALRAHVGLEAPRIGVLGVNPHAGEGGLMGDEEARIVAPALELLRRERPWAEWLGPLPADTAVARHARGALDGIVAMYHDQGLAPFKLLHFADGVNVTLGLPFVRTSPDHGTARDIAGKGIADPSSMLAAVQLARGRRW